MKPPSSRWNPTAFAAALAGARRQSQALELFSQGAPATLTEAYAGQAAAIAAWREPILGWKVGRIGEAARLGLDEDRFVGPIFAASVRDGQGVAPTAFDLIEGGTAALEVEYVVQLGVDAEPDRHYGPGEVEALIDRIYLGVEVAGSPVPDLNTRPALLSIAAFGNNLGLIVGAPLDGVRLAALGSIACEASLDGQLAGSGNADKLPGGLATAIAFALNKTAGLGRPMRRGALISTGATTGIHTVSTGQHLVARFGTRGQIQALTRPLPRADLLA